MVPLVVVGIAIDVYFVRLVEIHARHVVEADVGHLGVVAFEHGLCAVVVEAVDVLRSRSCTEVAGVTCHRRGVLGGGSVAVVVVDIGQHIIGLPYGHAVDGVHV